jgi:hypothetical protein
VDDWTAEALDGLADETVRSHVDLFRPVTMLIGNAPLRDLTGEQPGNEPAFMSAYEAPGLGSVRNRAPA